MAAAESLEEPDPATPRRTEPVIPIEPARVQGLPAEREPGKAVGLSLPRGHAQLPEQMDGATEVAATGAVREARGDEFLRSEEVHFLHHWEEDGREYSSGFLSQSPAHGGLTSYMAGHGCWD